MDVTGSKAAFDWRACLEGLAGTLGRRGLERVEAMLRVRAGEAEAERAPLQWPYELFLPGLEARPWHDPAALPWAGVAERAFAAVRGEFLRLRSRGVHQPYTEPFDEALHAGSGSRLAAPGGAGDGWTAYFLYRHGEWIEVNAAACPRTVEALSRTPMGPGEALFSVLAPGAEIPLHSGGCNVVLTCHLPLVVPDGCALRVGGETRTWEPGRLRVFDDSFAHAAWNGSDEPRAVLLWDVWHPGLTPVEISALRVLFPLLVNRDG